MYGVRDNYLYRRVVSSNINVRVARKERALSYDNIRADIETTISRRRRRRCRRARTGQR